MSSNLITPFRPCLTAGFTAHLARPEASVPSLECPPGLPQMAADPSPNVMIALNDYSDTGSNFHREFNALLVDLLARFANCPASQLDCLLDMAFRRACEFLDIDQAGLWSGYGKDAGAFVLTHLYPTQASSLNGRSDAAFPRINGDWAMEQPLEIGMDSRTCLPWMSGRAQSGATIVFLHPGQLPAEAEQDAKALARLWARSGAMIPFLVDGKVIGAASFVLCRRDMAWSDGLTERLKLLSQILSTGIARNMQADELLKSRAEIKRLKDRLQAETEYLKTEIKVTQRHSEIIGHSQAIKRVLHQVEQVAPADCAVLIKGETGTGKELIAQEIHRLSARKVRPMVLVNCAALPSALVESELFGRERGAYTGALSSQVGRFEVADGSTIFLDEVGELSLEVQAKLLRVLQQGEFQRLGSPKTHRVNVRVIAATNRDLATEVRDGRFREDLYYRLKVFPIDIPPLRERLDDLPLLVFAFMEEFSTRMGKKITRLPCKAMETLQSHSWPGNIRELRNVIEHSVIVTAGDMLKLSLPGDSPTRDAQPVTLAEAERAHILKALTSTNWRIKGPHGAAVRLNMQPSTLYSRMQKLGIPHRRQKDEMPT